MTADLAARFRLPPDPQSLQVLFPGPPDLDADGLEILLRDYHPSFEPVRVELGRVADNPALAAVVSPDGPPASVVGEIALPDHRILVVGFDAPMPYGPVAACVPTALMPDELKAEATAHAGHVLLYHAGGHPDPFERAVVLGAVAGAVARFGAIVTLNEEARAAVPAFDLTPADDEDVLATLRSLPLPYLFAGFVKLDVGAADRPWARTFAAHRFGLPDLARHIGHDQTRDTFELFGGVLGYLRATGERLRPGDTLDLGDRRLSLRGATEREWWLDSPGETLVVEPG
jgi:hypothetical protein